MLISPAELKSKKVNYDIDKDLGGYLYILDSDTMEEELKFEELLTKASPANLGSPKRERRRNLCKHSKEQTKGSQPQRLHRGETQSREQRY